MKRHEALVQISRDHHFGLLLCWKLKEGLKREISVKRMSRYIQLFYDQNLKPHFLEEENYIFPLLGDDHPMIIQAISEHRDFENMITEGFSDEDQIENFKNLLELHIRTEEREIFPEIERKATDKQFNNILKQDFPELKEPEYDDIFWK